MIELGEKVFEDGCPVCKDLCCCSNKSVSCERKNHCYRKCPATKSLSVKSGGSTNDASGEKDTKIAAKLVTDTILIGGSSEIVKEESDTEILGKDERATSESGSTSCESRSESVSLNSHASCFPCERPLKKRAKPTLTSSSSASARSYAPLPVSVMIPPMVNGAETMTVSNNHMRLVGSHFSGIDNAVLQGAASANIAMNGVKRGTKRCTTEDIDPFIYHPPNYWSPHMDPSSYMKHFHGYPMYPPVYQYAPPFYHRRAMHTSPEEDLFYYHGVPFQAHPTLGYPSGRHFETEQVRLTHSGAMQYPPVARNCLPSHSGKAPPMLTAQPVSDMSPSNSGSAMALLAMVSSYTYALEQAKVSSGSDEKNNC